MFKTYYCTSTERLNLIMKGNLNMKLRKLSSFITFFLLPITLNYFSPVLLVQAGFEKTFSVMHIVFALMTVSAVFFGAAWCSYICPFGALQDLLPDKGKKPWLMKYKAMNLKFITGTLFLILILWPMIQYGFKDAKIFYHMEDTKVTLDSMHGLILYYIITGSIVLICVIFGKRVWCRYFCPMYILNYIGIQISKILKIPRFKITPDSKKCTGCHKCSDACPMGLKVSDMVKTNKWNYNECIQCGECISTCKVIALKRDFKFETIKMKGEEK